MEYDNIISGTFLSRPNRFIAQVEINGQEQTCHVKNTGRCRELLIPGAQVFVQKSTNPLRKTAYDLITVRKGERLINIDSQAPNKVFCEWVKSGGYFEKPSLILPEQHIGNSRLDFYLEGDGRKAYIEVKGVTLEKDGVVSFPDAPTVRGVKHLRELISCKAAGFDACAAFIIQMEGVKYLRPNWETHEEFGNTLKAACDAGVRLLALDCVVTESSIAAKDFVEIKI